MLFGSSRVVSGSGRGRAISRSRGGFLKNFASPSGDGHWFRNLVTLKKNYKNPQFLGTN